MSDSMKWAIFAVVTFFAFIVITPIIAGPSNERDLERYTICTEAGGEYDHSDWSCDLP